jgi:hypothetical protein
MNATFVLLSFEGPDPYSNAGGLGARITDLSKSLASLGHETHLFFIGDPSRPGYESRQAGLLHLHRWGQWISQYHPDGVYDGEEGKLWDWDQSLPIWIADNLLPSQFAAGRSVIVMAEDWHTARSVVTLQRLTSERGWGDRTHFLWNANNPYGFDSVPWEELAASATITTVSRYMRALMGSYGVEPRVMSNGISDRWLAPVDPTTCRTMRHLMAGRAVQTKVARWDPDKGWIQAIEAIDIMKRMGMRPLLLARGGLEGYGYHVSGVAQAAGLTIGHMASSESTSLGEFISDLRRSMDADVLIFDNPLSFEQRRALFEGTTAVLANSLREPFGLVGLETMASGGVAMVGCSGEDYATPGYDSISLQSRDPWEIVRNIAVLRDSPSSSERLRKAARASAERYTWEALVRRQLISTLRMIGVEITEYPGRGATEGCAAYEVDVREESQSREVLAAVGVH